MTLFCLTLFTTLLLISCSGDSLKRESLTPKDQADFTRGSTFSVTGPSADSATLTLTKATNTELPNLLMVDKAGGVSVLNPEVNSEDLSTIVGHVAELQNPGSDSIQYNIYSRSTVTDQKNLKTKVPLQAGSQEITVKKAQIVKGQFIFLDANINDDEFYQYTDDAVLSLNLTDGAVDQEILKKYKCAEPKNCTRYIADWAQVRKIVINKYKKRDRNAKVKNLPPFVSAVFSGGEFGLQTDDSSKKTVYKLLVHLTPIKFWLH